MTIKEVCKQTGIEVEELTDEAIRYFIAKMARPQYDAYKNNPSAQFILLNDCIRETYLSMLSNKGKLHLAFGRENERRKTSNS